MADPRLREDLNGDAWQIVDGLQPQDTGGNVGLGKNPALPSETTGVPVALTPAPARGSLGLVILPAFEATTDLRPLAIEELDVVDGDLPEELWPPEARRPLVNIGGDRVAITGQEIAFDGSESVLDEGVTPGALAWDFGDGFHASGITANHAWLSPGLYTVTARAGGTIAMRRVRVLSAAGESDLTIIALEQLGATPEAGWSAAVRVAGDVDLEDLAGVLLYVHDGLDQGWRAGWEATVRELNRELRYPSAPPFYPQETVVDPPAGGTSGSPYPGANTGTPPRPGQVVTIDGYTFGRVPHPPYERRIVENSLAWDNLGPRAIVGTCHHRMEGHLLGTDGFFRGEAVDDALTDYGIGGALDGAYDGAIFMWNDPLGSRAPHANGGTDGLEGNGPAFVGHFGTVGVNRDLVSIELSGQQETPITPKQLESLCRLIAYWHDQAHVRWDHFPVHPSGVVTALEHFEFATKACPFVTARGLRETFFGRVREILRRYQVGSNAGGDPLVPATPRLDVVFAGYARAAATAYDANTDTTVIECEGGHLPLATLMRRQEHFFETAEGHTAGGTFLVEPPMRIAQVLHHSLQEHSDYADRHDVIPDWGGPRVAATTAAEGTMLGAIGSWAGNDFAWAWADRQGRFRYGVRPSHKGRTWMERAVVAAPLVDPSLVLSATLSDRVEAGKTAWVKLGGATTNGGCQVFGEYPCGGPPQGLDVPGGEWVFGQGYQYDDVSVLCAMAAHEYARLNRRYGLSLECYWRHDVELGDLLRLPLHGPGFDWRPTPQPFVVVGIAYQVDLASSAWITTLELEGLTAGEPCECPPPVCPKHVPGAPAPCPRCDGSGDGTFPCPAGTSGEIIAWHEIEHQVSSGSGANLVEHGGPTWANTDVAWTNVYQSILVPSGVVFPPTICAGTQQSHEVNPNWPGPQPPSISGWSVAPFSFPVDREGRHESGDAGELTGTWTARQSTATIAHTFYDAPAGSVPGALPGGGLPAFPGYYSTTDAEALSWTELRLVGPAGQRREVIVTLRPHASDVGGVAEVLLVRLDGPTPAVGGVLSSALSPPSGRLFESASLRTHPDDPFADRAHVLARIGIEGGWIDGVLEPGFARVSGGGGVGRALPTPLNGIDLSEFAGGRPPEPSRELRLRLPVAPGGARYAIGLRLVEHGDAGHEVDTVPERVFTVRTHSLHTSEYVTACGPEICLDAREARNHGIFHLTGEAEVAFSPSSCFGPEGGDSQQVRLSIAEGLTGETNWTCPFGCPAVTSNVDVVHLLGLDRTTTTEQGEVVVDVEFRFGNCDNGSSVGVVVGPGPGGGSGRGPYTGGQPPFTWDGSAPTGTCGNWPTAAAIDARIELSNAQNGRRSPLTGSGATFLRLGREYGVNPGIVCAILQRESQLGADGSQLPVLANNFGGITGEGNCGSHWVDFADHNDRYFAKFCTPEDGLRENFRMLRGSPYTGTNGSMGQIMELYSPAFENDWVAMWATFRAVAGQLGIRIEPDTSVWTDGADCTGGDGVTTPAPGAGRGFGGYSTMLEYSLRHAGATISQGPYGSYSHSSCDCYDISVVEGVSLYPLFAGTVQAIGFNDVYGNFLDISSAEGTIRFGHLRVPAAVSVGQRVALDTFVGYSGNTGNSTGPHLHLEVRGGTSTKMLDQLLAVAGFDIGGFTFTG